MTNFWKRSIAFLLTLCMTLSVLPPMVFAAEGSTPSQSQTVIYDFNLDGNTNFTLLDGTTAFDGQGLSNNSNADKAVDSYYANNVLPWQFFIRSTNATPTFGDAARWSGLRIYTNSGEGYLALKMKSPGAGAFDLTLKHQIYSKGGTGAVYILPGDITSTNIPAAMEATTPAVSFDCYSENAVYADSQATGSFTFTADTIYTLVFKLTVGGGNDMIYLQSLEATPASETPQETTDPAAVEMNYDFCLDGNSAFTVDGSAAFDGKTISATSATTTAIKNYYNAGSLNWYPRHFTTRNSAATFGDSSRWRGLRTDTSSGEGYMAMIIRSPGEGEFDLTLNYQLFNKGGAADMYILPGTPVTTAIATEMAAATPVISFNCEGANTTYGPQGQATGSYTFQADTQYTLVFNLTEGGGNNMIYLLSLHAASVGGAPEETTAPVETTSPEQTTAPQETTVPEETTTAPEETTVAPEETTAPEEVTPAEQMEYNFQLNGNSEFTVDGAAFDGKTLSATGAVANAIKAYYNAKKLNWYPFAFTTRNSGATFGDSARWNGLRTDTSSGQGYIAMKMRSPGAGKYDLVFNYQTFNKGGAGEVYILPGEVLTTEIADIMAAATPVIRFDCASEDALYADAKAIGSYTFGTEEMYTLVFKLTEGGASKMIYLRSLIAYAEGKMPVEPEQPVIQLDKAEYDFTKVDAVRGTSMPVGKHAAINALYQSGEINWNYAGRSTNNQAAIYGGINPTTGKNAGAWTGMRFAAKTGGGWVAYRIQSPGNGHYLVNVGFEQYSGLGAVMTYVLPGDTKNIDEALKTASSLGSYNCFQSGEGYKAANATMDRSAQFVAGEEYILVFYIENETDKPIYGSVNNVTLQRTEAAVNNEKGEQSQIVYDFNLGETDLKYENQSLNGRNVAVTAVSKLLKGLFYDEAIHWYYRSSIASLSYTATFGSVSAGNVWDGLVIYAKDRKTLEIADNFYIAFNIRSPGTGDFKLTVDYGVHMQGASQGSVYILPSNTKDIAAAIASGKAVGTINYDNGSIITTDPMEHGRTTFGNAVSMEKGKEYILVFTSDLMGRANNRIYIDSAMLTKVGAETPSDIIPYRKPVPKPAPAGSTVYDLDLCDPLKPVYKKKTNVLDVLDELDSRYASGAYNWTWAGQKVTNNATMQFTTTGLNVPSAEMEWIAVKIKSPGKGLYTVGLNHGVAGEGGTSMVYILPADTQDIEAAIDPSNRVGLINFDNNTGVTAVDDGYQTLLGTWEFGDDAEYIVVMEGFKASAYNDKKSSMYISQLFMAPGDLMGDVEEEKTISPVMVHPGLLKMLDACYYGTSTVVGGCNYLFMPIEGAKIMVIDLDNSILVGEIKLPFNVTRGIITDESGIVWVVGDGHVLFRYDPYTRTGETIKSFRPEVPTVQSCFYMDYADGCLYFGTSPSGVVVKYEIATDTYTNLGGHEDCAYAAAVAYKDGYVYSGMNGDSNGDGVMSWVVAKINVETGEAVYTDVSHMLDTTRQMFYGAGFAGDLLLMAAEPVQGEEQLIALDSNTMEIVDLGVKANISYGVSEEMDGKVYFVLSGLGLYSIDVKTREVEPVKGGKDMQIPIRCCTRSFIELNDPLYPGPSIVTYNGKGVPRIYNLETGKVKSFNDVIDPEFGNATTARPIINGLPGSNELYIGGFNTDNCAIYNTETGEIKHFSTSNAQTDAMVWYDGVLYSGNYTAGCITRIDIEDETKNQVLLTLNDDIYNQSRIHTLAAGDGKIFAGSTPDKYTYGGCFAMVDLETLERTVEHNIVQDQSVNCVTYHDGLVYGTTTIHGGSGVTKRTDLCAKLFIYDVEKKEKIAEFDLRDYMDGFTKNVEIIYGIAPDPNVEENGKFWGLVSETLFSFTYNKATGKLSVKEELSFRKDVYSYGGGWNWFSTPFKFDGEGNLYVSFGSMGGLRRINLENSQDNELVMSFPALYHTLGEDGNLYYLRRAALWMMPLNVTDEDWAQADQVDQLILALDDEITLKSEEAIVAARQAYDALDIADKALVQKLYLLEEAESDLLELQIAQLPETVTLQEEEMVLGLQAKYDAMTVRQQKYVKNYAQLEAAVSTINVLLDKQAAAEVQAMIDTIKDLGEITLEHKDRIAEIRAAYNKLFSYQRQYVDATDLLEAEAILAVLRAQEIERLKELIASIGEVTLEDEPIIVEADGIFSWLTMTERQQVDGATLSSAKIQLSKLQKAAAAEVDALIGKIGKVGIFSGSAISKARKAYDALTEGSKAYVSLIDALIAAEKAFKPIAIALWCVGGVVVVGGGAAATVVLKKKKRKAATSAKPTASEE